MALGCALGTSAALQALQALCPAQGILPVGFVGAHFGVIGVGGFGIYDPSFWGFGAWGVGAVGLQIT